MATALGLGIEEPLDRNGAFPRLDAEIRERLAAAGERLTVTTGDILFREGDDGYDFFAVESGAVAIVRGYGDEDHVIAVHGPHRFLGELNLLTRSAVTLTAVVRDPGEIIRVPRARFQQLMAQETDFANVIIRAFLARREILIGIGGGARVVGSRFSPESRRLREFLARNRVPFEWLDLEDDVEAERLLQAAAVDPEETPVVIYGERVLRNPSNAELGGALGLSARGAPPPMCDLVIIGGGPAGLAAAVYGASEGLDTQAGKFGARLVVPAQAVGLERQNGHFDIHLADGGAVHGRTVIVATGAQYIKLPLANLERFEGAGVYYAATLAEAQMCSNDPVIIVGGGNSAGQAALFLSRHASNCKLLIRGEDLAKSMSRYLIDELDRRPQVELMTCCQVSELHGQGGLEAVTITDRDSGEQHRLPAKALFVFIGASPHTEWLRGRAVMDDHGFLLTGRDLRSDDLAAYDGDRPLFLETSQPGLFAVGDVHSGSIKRVASAVGEGSMAVRLVHQRLSALVPA